MDQALSLKQVADLLQVPHYRISYALATHRIAEPSLRVSNRRVFQRADVARIAEHFHIPLNSTETVAVAATSPTCADAQAGTILS